MKKITLFSVLAVLFAALSLTSCNSDSGSGYTLPTKEEALAMMNKIGGNSTHRCGILFPGDNNNKIDKDSVEAIISINPADSSYTIQNFPVKLLAKYLKDDNTEAEKYKTLLEAMPNQTIKGKLYCINSTTPAFYTATQNINIPNDNKDNIQFAFYSGYTNYALAGISQDSKSFLLYLTPGAIILDGKNAKTDLFKSQSTSYSIPYIIYLKYAL